MNRPIKRLWPLLFLLILPAIFFFACDGNRSLGAKPITADASNIFDDIDGSDSTATWTGGAMRMEISPAILKSNYDDQAQVKVILYDDSHNPIAGKGVSFASSLGVIASNDTTDAEGIAEVTFTSEPIEADAWIVASYTNEEGALIKVARSVQITGLDLQANPATEDALVNSEVLVTIDLVDASGNVLSDQKITVTGAVSQTVSTNGSGRAFVTLTSSTTDTLNVTVNALGATATTTVRFWTKLPTGTNTGTAQVRNMRLFTSRTQLRADNSDEARVTAILLNEKNNPAVGDTVFFQSNLGIIGAFGVIDSTGRATVTLRSTAVVGTCTIHASALAGEVEDSIAVSFTGLSLQLKSDIGNARVGQAIQVTAEMRDASNNPIGGDPIIFQVTGGTFANGTALFSTNLDGNGSATVAVNATVAGSVQIVASALNANDSLNVTFTQDNLTLSSTKSWVAIGGVDSTSVTATYLDAAGLPIVGAVVSFFANAGTIGNSANTDAAGKATVTYKGAAFSGTAKIQAMAANGSATMEISVQASSATQIKLTATPDNIGVNGGVSNLMAQVSDVSGNTVTGETVSFRLLKGPGGGEAISQPTATSQTGKASSTLLAGSIPSSYRGVPVEACIGNGACDTIQLTISGLPYLITISRPQDDTIKVQKAGTMDSTVFQYFVGAVVQDVNGNPVADGTIIHFGASVSGMLVHTRYLVEWSGVNGTTDLKAVLGYRGLDIPFEDMNNNRAMDLGTDLTLDYNDAVARRGDDVNGNGVVDYDSSVYDFWFDFNNNGKCDPSIGEPRFNDSLYPEVYADLDRNGFYTESELIVDHDGDTLCDLPASGDFRYALWEMLPQWSGSRFDFAENDFAVTIAVSATTVNGVAETALTYPRQLGNRLIATVNAEANGIRDRDGERFVLPVILEQ